MKLLDKIALNRLLTIITSFILSLIKIFHDHKEIDPSTPKHKSIINRLKKLRNKNE